jgi:hypothetical protein
LGIATEIEAAGLREGSSSALWRNFPKFTSNVDPSIMTSIATSLWDSIFTPGPTPILVRAMNISFLALIGLLLPLIYVTQNIHVVFLTILAAGLWIAMQW